MATFDAAQLESLDDCTFYTGLRDHEGRLLKNYGRMIFAISLAAAASAIAVILGFVLDELGISAVSAAATVFSVGAVPFVKTNRDESKSQMAEFQKAVDKYCKDKQV